MPTEMPMAWVNGQQIPLSQAAVPAWDLGVVAGATISEMARTYRQIPFRLDRHLDRLFNSCQTLSFPISWSNNELADAAQELVRVNSESLADIDDLGIVWFTTAGVNPSYAAPDIDSAPTTCVHTFRISFDRWQNDIRDGVALTIPTQHQLPPESFPTAHKTRNRLHWWLADQDANKQRPGARALLTTHDGRITETSAACFFAVRDGTVMTPKDGVLQSTTRDVVREICDRLGIRFRLADLNRNDVDACDEIFLSSTPCGLLPVGSVDDHTFPARNGPILAQIQAEWTRVTGVDTFEQILTADSHQ